MLKRHIKKIFLEITTDITSFGNPLILVIFVAFILDINSILWKIIPGLVAVELFCTLIKILYHKERPKKEEYTNLLERINAGSFPSLHTARSSFIFLIFFFISPLYLIKIISIIMIIMIGSSRMILKKHYFSDIIIGLFIGLIFSAIWMKFIL